jgi:site-specific DNA-methyltransferase (adenine-specific)
MIKEQLENNENVKPNTKLLNLLKENFPDYFDKDNNFMIDKFKNTLKSDEINITKEGYELNFLGKSYARFQTSTETETIISPLTDHNNEDENKDSENLYIIGDNLDALKHLLKSYSRKVKCIYIDPPYNTGSDGFVYPDNFKFDSATLSNKMGIDEEEAERIIDMRGKSTHSAWLTFIYPRLVLARELLSDDGVIFISIDDNEQANLKLICDEIFGEENFIKDLIVNTSEGGGNAKYVVNGHETVLVYSKNILNFDNLKRPKDIRGKKIIIDGELYWIQEDSIREEFGKYGNLHYEDLLEKRGREYKEKIDNGIKNNEYILVPKSYGKTIIGKLRKISDDYSKFHSILNIGSINKHLTADGIRNIEDLFNTSKGNSPFETPKPIELLERLTKSVTFKGNDNDIILDFFSGSATTAHAVMKLNAEDGGNRKYILVQLPEEIEESKPAFKAGYKTIDEIGRERIKRAAQKIKEETNADIDYGFKVVKLENVQENTLDKLESFNPNVLVSDDYVNDFTNEDSSGLETILTTWLNQDGYGLHAKWEDFKLVDYIAHRYSNSLYIVNEGIESSDLSRLIEMIENNELNISRIVIYTYSLPFTMINELKTNIKNLRNNKTVDIIERY